MPSGHATIPPRPFRRGFWSALLRSATWGLVIVLALGAIPSAWGQETELKPSVEPALLRQIQKNDTAGYMIYFREKADLSAAQGMDWQARGRFVTQRLRETAERSQKRVRGYLDAAGASYTPFWIDNIIVVKSSRRATFSGLLAFSEIESLKVRRTMQLIKPEKTDARKVLDQVNDVESNLTHIGANTVWGWGYGGQNVVVANIDTGVRFSHEALVNQYRGNLGDGAFDHNYNWHDPYGDHPNAPADDNGHGTHTMGTMVGEGGGNSIGVAPHARWIAARGCNSSSCTDAALLSSAQWIAAPTNLAGQAPDPDKRPHVVNNSWGDCGAAYDGWYQDVVNAWHAAGIYPVFSNGNASNCGYSAPPGLNTVGNPGRYGNVTGVGSSGKSNGQYAPHSNWGPTDNADTVNPRGYAHLKPQVVAPGVDIRSSVPTSDTSYEDGWTGTSMSAPHVTGLIALMWSAAPHLIGNYAVTETLLEETATPIPYASAGTPPPGPGNVPNYATGWGEINAPAAVQAAMALVAYCRYVTANSVCPWACSTSARQARATGSCGTAHNTFSASSVTLIQRRSSMLSTCGVSSDLARSTSVCSNAWASARGMCLPGSRPTLGAAGVLHSCGNSCTHCAMACCCAASSSGCCCWANHRSHMTRSPSP